MTDMLPGNKLNITNSTTLKISVKAHMLTYNQQM